MKTNGKIIIAHIVLSLDIGGLETLVVNMIKKIDRRCFVPVVICLRKKGELAQELEKNDCTIHCLECADKLDITAFFKLAKLLIKEKVNIVHCHNTAGYFYGGIAAFLSGLKRIIYTEHGRVFPDTPRRMLAERILSWFTYRIVAVSDDMKNCLVKYEHINPSKIQVIYNGVDVEKFKRFTESKRLIEKRKEFGIEENDFIIGNVARFDAIKDHKTLIHAFAQAKKRAGRSLKLLLIGSGPEEKSCQELSNQLGLQDDIIFTGSRTDIPELMNIMNLFVLSSKNEGISLTLLEAIACGLSFVATNVGGTPEIAQKTGAGILVEPNNPQKLAEALASMIESPIVNKPDLSCFSLTTMMKHYEDVYV